MNAASPLNRNDRSIHPETRIGTVVLAAANLKRQLEFYQEVLGLRLHWSDGRSAGLGAGGEDLLRLEEERGARRVPGTTGLYHFALLLPNRRELARAVARLFEMGYPNYPTDHVATKTTYLEDPEGQEIELYAESPEDGVMGVSGGRFYARRSDGSPSSGREPLDLEALFSHLRPGDRHDRPLPAATRIGHVHLYVRDLEEALRFYTTVLGFDDMGSSLAVQAGFVSAGGYHHHVGLNTWIGAGAPSAPAGSLGMRYFTVVVPNLDELRSAAGRVREAGFTVEEREDGCLLHDPSRNGVLLAAAPRAAPEEDPGAVRGATGSALEADGNHAQ